MKETPLLFTGEMVRAILDGRKTQTRRIITPRPIYKPSEIGVAESLIWSKGNQVKKSVTDRDPPYGWNILAMGKLVGPYKVGGRIWARETWAPCIGGPIAPGNILYRADNCEHYDRLMWKPSIHMPRWASRITLEVVNVRVERVQDISMDDCQREGVSIPHIDGHPLVRLTGNFRPIEYTKQDVRKWTECEWWRFSFASLWDSINAKRGFGWTANPWVWVIEFKKIEVGQNDPQ